MGIKHFFFWFKNTFSKNITEIYRNKSVTENIDVFLIDMNGIFHNATQKIYMYGAFAPVKDILGIVKPPQRLNTHDRQIAVFREVCSSVDALLAVVRPKKTLVLCVDGPAPIAKQCQQRKRRFMSALNNEQCPFDSNSITPGTKFMNYLTKYIDWYIRKRISENHELYKGLEIIFSNEKVVGEGEHKCFAYLRKYGNDSLKYCLHGMDADLIMLSLAAQVPNFYILRENQHSHSVDYYFIDIGNFKKDLVQIMKWGPGKKFIQERAVHDFIFMCFMVGNDFLPHIPAIEIITGGIDYMLQTYKKVGEQFGHLTKNCMLRKKALVHFLDEIGKNEKKAFLEKLESKHEFISDPLLEKHIVKKVVKSPENVEIEKTSINIVEYRKEYFKEKFPENEDPVKISHAYLQGMQWVLSYYVNGVSNWNWRYPYHYAPFASVLSKCVESFVPEKENISSTPSLPFIQLLSVLPPKSANLLPSPLSALLTDENSPLKEYCPSTFKIDSSGCRQEWEATVILPFVNLELVNKAYNSVVNDVEKMDLYRNKHGKTFIYKRGDIRQLFSSFYGGFESFATCEPIDL